MAKAKVLADTISISSEILTDANIRKVKALAPSVLRLVDWNTDVNPALLYEVTLNEDNWFTKYGASFSEGKTISRTISEDMEENELMITSVLTKLEAIETQVDNFIKSCPDISKDIKYLD